MSLSTISTILSLLYSVLRISRDFFMHIDIFKRNRRIKKDYKEGEKAVNEGDVDKINEIIKS